jgi:hypothetical protein
MPSADELRDETGAPERNPLPEEVAEGETETERNLEQAGGGENPEPSTGEGAVAPAGDETSGAGGADSEEGDNG